MRLVPHNADIPVPTPPPAIDTRTDDSMEDTDTEITDTTELYESPELEKQPHLINQEELNDLVWDLVFSKKRSELGTGFTLTGVEPASRRYHSFSFFR